MRTELPRESGNITDKQIQDALWHYYYDVPKSVGYLVNTYLAKPKKENIKTVAKKSGGLQIFTAEIRWSLRRGAEGGVAQPAPCSKPFAFVDFFKDMPWLNIPMERQTMFVEPLCPGRGLVGGSSDGAPKMSKLQALAMARKKKAQEQKIGSSGIGKPISELSITGAAKLETSTDTSAKSSSRGFPLRKKKDTNQHEKHSRSPSPKSDFQDFDPDIQMEISALGQAEPSAFANTMFSSSRPLLPPANLFTLPYTAVATTATDAFAGPSPDDVVIAAQSKGPTVSGKLKK